MNHFGKILLLAGVALVTAIPANAAPASTQVAVHYGDLNLNRPEGAHAFIARLQVAASQVCGGKPDTRALERKTPYRTCMKLTMDRAVAGVSAARVADLYGTPRTQVIAAR